MKKTFHILLLSVFLSSCASLSDLTNLVVTPTPPASPTVMPSVTPAPTQNLFATSTSTPLTFTPTVTQIGAEHFTPTATSTSFPTPTPGLPPALLSNGSMFTPIGFGFVSVVLSNTVLYWNEGPCTSRSVKVSAFVQDVATTSHVLLFTRLREKKNTLHLTDWNSGAIMTKTEDGSFTYDLGKDNLRQFIFFKDAWIEYQLVALTEDQEIIGRTQIYDRNLSLVRCMPVP